MHRVKPRRLHPVGPELAPDGAHLRVWAPAAGRVEALFEGRPPLVLEAQNDGWFSGFAAGAGAGSRYRFRLDGGDAFPDPASMFQPEGPDGPSELVDLRSFFWTDASWRGPRLEEAVLYELHVGTFTAEGTYAAAIARLPELAEIGVTILELMPVNEFAGTRGWGYDGVFWSAPTRLYGRPEDLQRFIDAAHGLGLGVILDVVYNHFGPVGNCLPRFSEEYVDRERRTDWGPAVNFGAGPARALVLSGVRQWIEDYRFDGLRVDATQNIADDSELHVLAEATRVARAAAFGRRVYLVAENEPQDSLVVEPARRGGWGFDAVWSDDFHHAASVALTGRREAYLEGYRGEPQELVSALKRGFLYQGQHYAWQKKARGTPSWGLAPSCFVHYLENHDQVANGPDSSRLRTRCAPADYRAMLAVLLLGPQTPLLFQGQEFGLESPFHFFADLEPGLAAAVHAGRRDYVRQFPTQATPAAQARVLEPASETAWKSSVLDRSKADPAVRALVRDLLRLRKEDRVFRARGEGVFDGAVLGPRAFCLRWHGAGDRLLVVNLGVDLDLGSVAEPLLAPPGGSRWNLLWSSEASEYGGHGMAPLERPGWYVPGHAAAVLRS